MRHIKKMDFYRKYTNEDAMPTTIGACVSLLTMLLVIFFATFEFSRYISPSLNHEVLLAQFPVSVRENTIPLNFDIFFHKIPCGCNSIIIHTIALKMSLHDMFGTKHINIANANSIKMRRLNSNLEFLDPIYISRDIAKKYPKLSPGYQILLTQILENEGCEVSGYIDVYKAPGTINFFLFLREDELLKIGLIPKEMLDKITLTHSLKSLTFGNVSDQADMISKFGESTITDFNKADDIPFQKDINFCLYYFMAVPHMFSVAKEKINKETYQYSIVYNCQNSPMHMAAYQLTLAFKVNPVGIHYNKEEWSIFQVMTAISAIIAGIYVIMSILTRILNKLAF